MVRLQKVKLDPEGPFTCVLRTSGVLLEGRCRGVTGFQHCFISFTLAAMSSIGSTVRNLSRFKAVFSDLVSG